MHDVVHKGGAHQMNVTDFIKVVVVVAFLLNLWRLQAVAGARMGRFCTYYSSKMSKSPMLIAILDTLEPRMASTSTM
jgi:hypothetical protein